MYRPWLLAVFGLVSLMLVSSTNVIVHPQNQTAGFTIPARRAARQYLVPINNDYGIDNSCGRNHCGDFHIAMYYKSPHTVDVIVRRLDQLFWDFNISIFIEALPTHSSSHSTMRELFVVGPSRRCDRRFLLTTTVVLGQDRSIFQDQAIPKVIVQTYFTRTAQSIFQISAHQTFVDLNPEYEIQMFTDKDCRLFLKKYFSSEVLDAYDILIAPTFKSDLFRYAYLALRGGCYFDHKMILRKPLRRVIQTNDTLLVCSDANAATGATAETLEDTKRLYNAVICTRKQDYRMWQSLVHVIRNINQRHSTGSDLSLTGPVAFYDAIVGNITDINLRFKHGFAQKSNSIFSQGRSYLDYFVKETLSNELFLSKYYKGFVQDPNTKYGNLWRSQVIFYDLINKSEVWKIFAYPGQKQCFQSSFDRSKKLLTLRMEKVKVSSSLLPWKSEKNDKLSTHQQQSQSAKFMQPVHAPSSVCQHIKLYIVNDETSETYKLEIPQDQSNYVSEYTIPIAFETTQQQ